MYVGLPGLRAEDYVTGDNWLGVALSALMAMPPERAGELGLEALRRLKAAGLTEQREYLLSECVETYLPVGRAELARIQGIIDNEPPARGPDMQRNKTRYDLAWEKGLTEGERNTLLRVSETLLTARFGSLTANQLMALRKMTNAELDALGPKVFTANTPADLGLGSE